ncbi:4'-phosphopantetheinyl transferase superfamily protein [Pseudophaeobacter sp.]|uniref:4'-phosphopantetheinyl transferase family protein n=1 Tax=Pseudophaeobacter sp. TaxID=1971739 RepID=UPI003299C56E
MRQNVSLFLCPVVDLDEGLLAALLAELTLQERQRARRFSCNQAYHLFVVAHAALHWALRDAGVHRYDLACNPQGKPYLRDHPDLHFNLSHTEGLIAVALCAGRPIGVDVERLADLQTYQELAARVMTPAECSYMAAQSTPQDRFTQLWSAKEALMKATGLGFALPPREIEFSGPAPTLCRLPPEHGLPGDWRVCCQRLPGHWLALASRVEDLTLEPTTLTPLDLLSS